MQIKHRFGKLYKKAMRAARQDDQHSKFTTNYLQGQLDGLAGATLIKGDWETYEKMYKLCKKLSHRRFNGGKD